MSDGFIFSLKEPEQNSSQAWWFIFSGYRLLVKTSDNGATVPFADSFEFFRAAAVSKIFLGTYRGFPCYAAAAESGEKVPAGFSFEEIRSLFDRLDDGLYEAAISAVHLVGWDRNSRFCGKCRGEMTLLKDAGAKECTNCGRQEFPRVSPAIIVLIERDDTVLLARSARFPAAFFSVLAGFVEPGETLESAVHREVMEETGIAVKDIRYFGSQPWPFPDSLMIGFTARYESGEIKIDGEEIVEAGWYRIDNMPQLPGKLSIARQLIDSFVAKHC